MTKFRVGLAAAGLIGISTLYAYAAGLFPDFPVVGGASYCAGSSQSATGSIIGSVTGCPNTVPAGPTIVTGNEQVPADTRLSSGQNPQTVLLPMASLNALPILVSQANNSAANRLSATNTQGGIILTGNASLPITNISSLNVSLPPTPIDGQQFLVSANLPIATLSVTATTPSTQSISNAPSVLSLGNTNTTQNGVPQGLKWMWNAAASTWYRIQ